VKGNTNEEGTRTANELRGNRIGGDVIFTVCWKLTGEKDPEE
jgi:hypothetical protein